MSKSQRLRVSDVQAVHQMVLECIELGDDHWHWREHLGKQLCRLVDAKVFMIGESCGVWPKLVPIAVLDMGWDSQAERDGFLAFMKEKGIGDCEVFRKIYLHAPRKVRTILRQEVVEDAEWYRSEHFQRYVKTSQLDGRIASFYEPHDNASLPGTGLSVHRPLRDRQFNVREKRIVELAHQTIVPLIGKQLASEREPAPSELSPRLREVLGCLLEGDSEKEAAARLNVTANTLHQYVKRIYRHFRVSSRAELMALWIRRLRTSRKRGG